MEKNDAPAFRAQLAALRARLDGDPRQWWSRYLFHFADLSNVLSILADDELVSRSQAAARTGRFHDSASPDIIEQTDAAWKDYVRFYLRPRTPTLYRNEGFRPVGRYALGAHCPAPVYLLFDLESVICQKGVRFSYGSLAWPDVPAFDCAADFAGMPFDLIYHDTRFEPGRRDAVIFHRHAEVIVPQRIGLAHLRWLWCRSAAEYDTLRTMLPPHLWQKWRSRVVMRTDSNLFNREWVYVERVALTPNRIIFHFNPASRALDSGLFDVRVEVRAGARSYTYHERTAEIGAAFALDLPDLHDYRVTLYLDDHLAYAGRLPQQAVLLE